MAMFESHHKVESPSVLSGKDGEKYATRLLEKAHADAVLKELGSELSGLSESEAGSRLKQVGTNEIAREKHQSSLMRVTRD